ncbi:MAG: hypothetical protein R6U95_02005, partial [Bacteroidales bacterium]
EESLAYTRTIDTDKIPPDSSSYLAEGDQIGNIIDGVDSAAVTLDFAIDDVSAADVRISGNTLTIESGGKQATVTIEHGEEGTTIKDAEGNLYAVDQAGTLSRIGKSGENAAQQIGFSTDSLDDEREIRFSNAGTWAFDSLSEVYAQSKFAEEFEQIDGTIIPWKFVPIGKADKVQIHVTKGTIDLDKVTFTTPTGTEFFAERSGDDIVLTLIGAKERDGYELYAVYQEDDSTTTTIGKLNIASYPLVDRFVTIVPMHDKAIDTEQLTTAVNTIYKPYGIRWHIEVDSVFTDRSWDTEAEGLQATGSEWYSEFTAEMRALNNQYVSQRGIDEESVYIFWFAERSDTENLLGDMPLKSRFGYLFTPSLEDAHQTIAHELAHVQTKPGFCDAKQQNPMVALIPLISGRAFQLRHTFSERYGIEKHSTPNLMDYARGSELTKYQWDIIHDPHKMLFPWMQGEEEGRIQGFSDLVCTQKFIEQFRWAYVHQEKLIYEADGYPWYGHHASDITLDGRTFKEIKVEVREDISFIPNQIDYEQIYTRAVFNYRKDLSITTQDQFYETEKYLFPSTYDYERQIEELITETAWEEDRDRLLAKLAVIPYQEYVRFSGTQREKILNIIASGTITEDALSCQNDEEIVVNLVKYVSNSDLSSLFATLENGDLMQKLCSKLNNTFGEENYTKFIGALTFSFMRYKKDKMTYVLNNWKEYTREQSRNNKITHFVWNREFSSDSRITYRKHYENNKIIIKTWSGGMFDIMAGDIHSYTRPPLDPFDIVTVYFSSPPKHVSEDIPADIWLAMPAFMFEWYLNEFHNKQITAHLDGAVTLAAFIIPVSQIHKGRKVLLTIHAIIGGVNVALLNDKMEQIVKDNFNDNIYETWQSFSYLVSLAGSPFQDIVLEKHLTNTATFFAAWNAFKSTEKYSYLLNDKASKEAITIFEGLLENINNIK